MLSKELFLSQLRSVLPADRPFIGLHEPTFAGNEWAYVKECLDTGWVSSAGKYVTRFEEMLAEFTGIPYAIATGNGTAALHICLVLANVQPNDEVLMPALTFVATANAISYCHAVQHFVDSEWKTLGVDAAKLDDYLKEIGEIRGQDLYNKQTNRRIRAVVPMHAYGHPVDLDALAEVCQKYNIVLIEDAAESLGSYYKGKHTGSHGFVSALSFNGNKTITTGGGGAILTHDPEVAKLAKHLTTTAKLPHAWAFYHDRVGYNYRLPNLNAALGCAQLEQLAGFLTEKRKLAERYAKLYENIEGVDFVSEPDFARSNYWLNAVVLSKENQPLRDEILDYTNQNGLMTRPAWTLMHRLPMYQNCPKMDLSTAEDIESRLINIPSSPFLAE